MSLTKYQSRIRALSLSLFIMELVLIVSLCGISLLDLTNPSVVVMMFMPVIVLGSCLAIKTRRLRSGHHTSVSATPSEVM
ncbi:MAG: hypothetical protein ACXADS_04045 [Candidatus Thorarchaeota archaeon]